MPSRILRFVVLLSLLLPSCSAMPQLAKPVTITFSFPRESSAYYTSILPQFTKTHPNITVEMHPWAGRSSENADVSLIEWSMLMDPSAQISQNYLSLDTFIAQDKSFNRTDFFPGTMNAFTIDGKLIALPITVDPWVLYYNKDLFDKQKVAYPPLDWSWNDFLDRAQALRNTDQKTYGYASINEYIDAIFFVYQHGGRLLDSNQQPTLTDPLTIEAFEWYARLYRDMKVAPNQMDASSDFGGGGRGSEYIGVIMGKVGMWIAPLSARGGAGGYGGGANVKWNFNYGMAPLPHDAQSFTISYFNGLAIGADTKSPDTAWEWVKYVSSQPNYDLVSARLSVANSPDYAKSVGSDVDNVTHASMNNASLVSRNIWGSLGSRYDALVQAISSMVNSDQPVADILDQAQKQMQQSK